MQVKLKYLLPNFSTFSTFQRQQFSKYWLDISKLVIGSLVIKFFEPQTPQFTLMSGLTMLIGLTSAMSFAIIGLHFTHESTRNNPKNKRKT